MQTRLSQDSNFDNNWRRQQDLKMRPVADNIYKKCWGNDITISRTEHLADYVLDRFFGVDVIITLPTKMILTGQEKYLSPTYARYKSITVEYMNNPKKEGDWFQLACQFYFCGYITNDFKGFQFWAILNWPAIVNNTLKNKIPWQLNDNKHDNAQASFKYCNLHKIPSDCFINKSW